MMIEINLLPEELKVKAAKASNESKYYLLIIPVILAIFILLHIVFLLNSTVKMNQLGGLKKKWQELQPQLKVLEGLKVESGNMSNIQMIQQLALQRINWAQKVYKLSFYLPKGVWFTNMSVTTKVLSLKGSVLSLQKEEMVLINKFMVALKKDNDFMGDFSNLELSSVQKKEIGGYEITDFMLTITLKEVVQPNKPKR